MYARAMLLVAELINRQKQSMVYADHGDLRVVSPIQVRSINAHTVTPSTSKYPKNTPTLDRHIEAQRS